MSHHLAVLRPLLLEGAASFSADPGTPSPVELAISGLATRMDTFVGLLACDVDGGGGAAENEGQAVHQSDQLLQSLAGGWHA